MIEARRQQLHFGDGLIAEEVSELREEWMKHADRVLEDEQLVATHHLQCASAGWVTVPEHHARLWQETLAVEQRPLEVYEEVGQWN